LASTPHGQTQPPRGEPFSLYIHIPYCVSKCPYCDFNSHVVPSIPETRYTEALVRELSFYGATEAWRGRSVQSVFFGGGTPSTFRPESIGRILERSQALFDFQREVEITLEANPGTVDSANFSGYRAAGVNRISLGIQSFQPRWLELLGRVHSAAESREALRIIRGAGFTNFNLDLMYALPGQPLVDLEQDLMEALGFDPPHLSAYNLTFEEGTPFYRRHRAGSLNSLPEEEEIAMAELIESTLADRGLERYEISNYALPGLHSRHNVNYWEGGDYLGIGAGAHAFRWGEEAPFRGKRWQNEKEPGRYITSIGKRDEAVVESDRINLTQAAGEFMFLGLRMTRGISVETFTRRFGKSPGEYYSEIEDWVKQGWMEEREGRLRLTSRGLLVANSLFVNFV